MKENKKQDLIENIEGKVKDINNKIGRKNESALKKYPVMFSLLTMFSLVCILHGFELIFAKINFVQNQPWVLLLIGLVILIGTGRIYRVFNKNI